MPQEEPRAFDMVIAAPTRTPPVALQAEEDAVLAARAGAGDHRAFELIMRRHNRALYRAARSVLKDDTEAEDVVQDAYVRAYHALAGFRGESALSTWLTRIVINKALERLRKRRREPLAQSSDNVIDLEKHLQMASQNTSAGETPERALMRAQTRELLERKIDDLPAPFRTVFVLRALEDMSVEECAASLNLTAATVRTRFFRARRLLRQSLAQQLNIGFDEAFSFAGARCDRIVASVLARITSTGAMPTP
jgi:RNA polymerase sigma-70 factor (ECF subfamily)